MNIIICTDSRGALSPAGHNDNSRTWPVLLKNKTNHNIEIAAWNFSVYTFDRLYRSIKDKKYDLIISQLGQNEMCLGPYDHKMSWAKEIPPEYKTVVRNTFKGCLYNYDTLVDCQKWLIDTLNKIKIVSPHLSILPTRVSTGTPDESRLNELRDILKSNSTYFIELPFDLPNSNITYDGEHYTFQTHEFISEKVKEKINSL